MTAAKGWIGVDLDGTLAEYDGWKGEEHIGPPIPLMVERVRRWLAAGWEVRILTARASEPNSYEAVARAVGDWTEKYVGTRLRATAVKDYQLVELWDDRAVAVEANTGRPLTPSTRGLE